MNLASLFVGNLAIDTFSGAAWLFGEILFKSSVKILDFITLFISLCDLVIAHKIFFLFNILISIYPLMMIWLWKYYRFWSNLPLWATEHINLLDSAIIKFDIFIVNSYGIMIIFVSYLIVDNGNIKFPWIAASAPSQAISESHRELIPVEWHHCTLGVECSAHIPRLFPVYLQRLQCIPLLPNPMLHCLCNHRHPVQLDKHCLQISANRTRRHHWHQYLNCPDVSRKFGNKKW